MKKYSRRQIMIEKFVRLRTRDGLEMCGMLCEPENKTNRAVIHVHGLSSNFYGNMIVSKLSRFYTSNGYAFLSVNNRGSECINDFKKADKRDERVIGGAYAEAFEECVYDIGGYIDFLDNLGYNEYILEGHSYGCNKIVYYYNKFKDERIKKLLLLAPCDVVQEFWVECGDKSQEILSTCKEKIANGREYDIVNEPSISSEVFTAKTVINNFSEDTDGDIFRYRNINYISKILNNINIPVTCIIGTEDNAALTQHKDVVNSFLKRNIKDISINYIEGSGHSYIGYENDLVEIVKNEF
jgi:pimeloyl-ACP methyl ester carboxylesterase